MVLNLGWTGKVMLAAVAFIPAGSLFGELVYLVKDFFKVVRKND